MPIAIIIVNNSSLVGIDENRWKNTEITANLYKYHERHDIINIAFLLTE